MLARISPGLGGLFRRAGLGGVSDDGTELLFEIDMPVHFLEEHNHFSCLDGDQESLIFYLPKYDC